MGSIKIDAEKLAQGLYQVHLELYPKSLALRMGMLDAKILNLVERELSERVPDRFYFAGDPLTEFDGKTLREKTMHKVCAEVFRLAKRDGILIP